MSQRRTDVSTFNSSKTFARFKFMSFNLNYTIPFALSIFYFDDVQSYRYNRMKYYLVTQIDWIDKLVCFNYMLNICNSQRICNLFILQVIMFSKLTRLLSISLVTKLILSSCLSSKLLWSGIFVNYWYLYVFGT